MIIDDAKLQLFVDGELEEQEIKLIANFVRNNPSAKKKVQEYRKINNLLFEKYKSIEQKDLPQKTFNLLMKEEKSFIKKLLSYEIKLINAIAAVTTILFLVIVSNYNFQNGTDMQFKNLKVKNKNLILNELKNIIGDDEISSLTSSVMGKNINYKIINKFKNNANESCSEIMFYDFKIKDLHIDEATFCGDKIIQLKFFKGDIKLI